MKNERGTLVRERHATLGFLGKWGRGLFVSLAVLGFVAVKHVVPLGEFAEGVDEGRLRTGLAILVVAAVLWLTEALPLALTAILVAVMSAVSGLQDVTASFAGFAHPLIFLFLGGFGMAAAMSKQGLDRWIASGVFAIGKGSFHVTALLMFAVSAGLSMWISNTATVAMLLPVALGVLGKMQAENPGKAGVYLLLGIAYSAAIGGMGTLIGTPPNAIAAAKLGIDFHGWLKIGLPAVAILLPVMVVVLRAVVRPGAVERLSVERVKFHFSTPRLATLLIFVATAAAWLWSTSLAKMLGIGSGLDTIIALCSMLLLAVFRLVRWRDVDRATDWGVLLLFGGGITLSQVLGESGASVYLAERIRVCADGWPPLLFVGAVVMFMVFLTELSSNTASAALMVPIFATVAGDLGMSAREVVLPITLAASCAFMLPVATPPNAIVNATGHVPRTEMLKAGLALNLVLGVLLTVLAGFF